MMFGSFSLFRAMLLMGVRRIVFNLMRLRYQQRQRRLRSSDEVLKD